MNKMKNAIQSTCNRVQQMEDRINELEVRDLDVTQSEKKNSNNKKWKKDWRKSIWPIGIPQKNNY